MATQEFNFIISNQNLESNKDLISFLFNDDPIEFLEPTMTMWDILVKCEIFQSKSQARKDPKWTSSTIPEGFNIFALGKLKHKIYIWNPINYENFMY